MKKCRVKALLCVLCLSALAWALAGCGSASSAERLMDELDAQRASIAADRNNLLLALLHDKSVYATRDAVNTAKLSLAAAAKNGSVSVADAGTQLDAIATEVNLAAQERALNRLQVETLNIAEERANALSLGLRIQIEASKGIVGRVMESYQRWRANQAPPSVAGAGPASQPE